METATFDISPYLKFMSPPRADPAMLQEIHYNSPPKMTHEATTANFSISENEGFCTKHNVEECLQYINKEFQVLGQQSIYNGNGDFDLIRLVNVSQKLLKKCQQSSRYREELETRVHRCSADLEHSQNLQKKLRQNNKSLQNTIGKCEEVERQLRIENSTLHVKLKSHSDEVKRLRSVIQSNENQYRHEVKKKERQLQLIKERTQQVMSDKSKQVPSIEMSECLMRRDGRRSKWRNESSSNRNEEDMYNTVMSNFERRCTVLQSENTRLRDLLADIQHEMSELSTTNSPRKTLSPSKDLLQLPVDMIHQRLSESLRSTCERIKSTVSSAQNNDLNTTFTIDSCEQKIEELETELNTSRRTVDTQRKIIESYKEGDSSNQAVEISLLEEQESLSKEKTLFYKQKLKLEQDKQNLAEAALKLQKEKKKLDEYKRMNLSSSLNGATLSRPSSALSPSRSPGRAHDDRISEHIEHVKLAVEEHHYQGGGKPSE